MIYYVGLLERSKFVPTLYHIPVLGGTPTKVLDHVSGAIAFSPDGKRFAFVRRNPEDMALMVANTDGSGEPKQSPSPDSQMASLLPDPHGLLMESGSLAA
jgi:Tol biopolymer transport system component